MRLGIGQVAIVKRKTDCRDMKNDPMLFAQCLETVFPSPILSVGPEIILRASSI